MIRPPALAVAAVAVLVSVGALAGCSFGHGDRVGGGRGDHVRELTLLDLLDPQEVTPFMDEVSRLSDGQLRIHLVRIPPDGTDYEGAVIRQMQDGRADLAVAGSRAWDEFGAAGLRALGAPFLIDSYPLEARVLESKLVDTMLRELRPTGLVGIGILPGLIRRPLGLSGTLATPEDFRGLTIGTQQSSVADATMRAFGARPQRLQADLTDSDLEGLGGIEAQVSLVESARLDRTGSHLMTNVDLWPRPLVVFAGGPVYSRLTTDQRQILRAAVKNVIASQAGANRKLEIESAADLCRKGRTDFDTATPLQLQALRHAVEPVYAELDRDAQTRESIEAIMRLKQQLAEPSSQLPACTPASDAPATGTPTMIDGVWTMQTDRGGAGPEGLDENWGHWVFVFDRGRFAITQENKTSCTWGYGTYAVNGTRMSWTFEDGGGIAPNNAMNKPGEYFVFDFSLYRDTLELSAVPGQISPLNFRAEPWRRLSTTPTTEQFSKRCPPPAFALNR
jgi:TRAP-type C4-dicarboxylate transport system substrate-binding protein